MYLEKNQVMSFMVLLMWLGQGRQMLLNNCALLSIAGNNLFGW